MDSGIVVIDISSDEEPDEVRCKKPLVASYGSIIGWLNGDVEEVVGNDVVDVDQYLSSVESSGSLRPKSTVMQAESDDDCMVLDGDPDKPAAVGKDKSNVEDESDDLQIVGQKGQVACRDFPHSRHLCANFPFNSTSHVKHCNMCHCFVCDSSAPCNYWGNGMSSTDHCHAIDKDETWKAQRKSFKKSTMPIKKPPHPFLRNPNIISRCTQVPSSLPIQPAKVTSFRPSSTTTTVVTSERQHNNHRVRTIQKARVLSVHRDDHHSLSSSSLSASHTEFKKTGSIMNRPQHTTSSRNQIYRNVPQKPRPLLSPVTTQTHTKTTLDSSDDDSIKKWQDILAGVAAELGVSDTVSKTSTSSQPYTASSQTPVINIPMSNQGVALHNDVSVDFDSKWLDASDQNFLERGSGDPQLVTVQPSISHFSSIFADEKEISPVHGKEIGVADDYLTSFLFDFEEGWNGTGGL